MASLGNGPSHGVSKESLAWKVTFEAGPEGEGYVVQRSRGGAAQGGGGAAAAMFPVPTEQWGPVGPSGDQGDSRVSGR